MPAGRPTRYNKECGRMAKVACGLGATNEDLGALFGVSKRTIERWEKAHPEEFRRPIREGKEEANSVVEQSLYNRAIGGKKTTEKRVTVNPDGSTTKQAIEREEKADTAACIFWLKNRDTARWRDRPEGDDGDEIALPLKISFKVNEPVDEIQITNAKPRA